MTLQAGPMAEIGLFDSLLDGFMDGDASLVLDGTDLGDGLDDLLSVGDDVGLLQPRVSSSSPEVPKVVLKREASEEAAPEPESPHASMDPSKA